MIDEVRKVFASALPQRAAGAGPSWDQEVSICSASCSHVKQILFILK